MKKHSTQTIQHGLLAAAVTVVLACGVPVMASAAQDHAGNGSQNVETMPAPPPGPYYLGPGESHSYGYPPAMERWHAERPGYGDAGRTARNHESPAAGAGESAAQSEPARPYPYGPYQAYGYGPYGYLPAPPPPPPMPQAPQYHYQVPKAPPMPQAPQYHYQVPNAPAMPQAPQYHYQVPSPYGPYGYYQRYYGPDTSRVPMKSPADKSAGSNTVSPRAGSAAPPGLHHRRECCRPHPYYGRGGYGAYGYYPPYAYGYGSPYYAHPPYAYDYGSPYYAYRPYYYGYRPYEYGWEPGYGAPVWPYGGYPARPAYPWPQRNIQPGSSRNHQRQPNDSRATGNISPSAYRGPLPYGYGPAPEARYYPALMHGPEGYPQYRYPGWVETGVPAAGGGCCAPAVRRFEAPDARR